MRSLLKRLSIDLFLLADRLGLHVLPKHFYSPVSDYRWLREHPALWVGRASLTGVHWDLDEQLRWLADLEARCRAQFASFKVPRAFRTVPLLPRNAMGKIQKHLLER